MGIIRKGDICSYNSQTVTLLTGPLPCAGGTCADVEWFRDGQRYRGTVNYDALIFIRRPEA